MNEPMLTLRLEARGKGARRFAAADGELRAEPSPKPQAPATIRTRWPAAIAP